MELPPHLRLLCVAVRCTVFAVHPDTLLVLRQGGKAVLYQ